eukprot:jgi/Tetstr1/463525/TSEL_008404.t1
MAELPGRLWDGKQALLEALAALAKGCPQEMDQGQVVAALLAAAERKKVAYHTAALAALEVALRAFGDADHFAAVSPPLLEACRRRSTADDKAKAAGGEEAKEGGEEAALLPLAESLRCLAAAAEGASAATLAAGGAEYAAALALCLSSFHAWPVRSAALAGVQGFVRRLVAGGGSAGDAAMGEAQASGEQAAWLALLVPGILDCTTDGKISQLRSLAMKALAEVLQFTAGGASLAPELRATVGSRLQELLAGEKNTVVKAEVAKTAKLLEP